MHGVNGIERGRDRQRKRREYLLSRLGFRLLHEALEILLRGPLREVHHRCPSRLECTETEMKPGWCRIAVSVCSDSSCASAAWFAGSTVQVLTSVRQAPEGSIVAVRVMELSFRGWGSKG